MSLKQLALSGLFIAAITTTASGQQPNTFQASMIWGGTTGPSWPIVASLSPTNPVLTLEMRGGGPFLPYVVTHAPAGLLASGVLNNSLGGYLDQDLSLGFQFLLNGVNNTPASPWNAFAFTGSNGLSSWSIPLASTATLHLPGLQGAVADPTTASGLRLTAATDLLLYPACNPGSVIGANFAVPSNVPSLSGAMGWNSGGFLEMTYIEDLVGNGSDGAVVFGPGVHDIDTTPGTGAPSCAGNSFVSMPGGVLNATSIHVTAGATLRVYGSYPLHWKCSATALIEGTIDCSGFRSGVDSSCYGSNPGQGNFNNLGLIVAGGLGGPGAGRGGRASQFGATRTPRGELGFGPSLNGVPNYGFPINPHFGGGGGGIGDFFSTALGTIGGYGGAGGSSFTGGEDGTPRSGLGVVPLGSCGAPLATPIPHLPSPANGPTAAFQPPITSWTAGSGGGGGGDKFDNAPVGSNFDEQGGGGGGGGGCFRLSALGAITLSASAVIRCQGAPGGVGPTFTGAGGAGSGGLVWIQCFDALTVNGTASIDVSGGGAPAGNISCTGAPGRGGTGYIQLEDLDGVVNSNFSIAPSLSQSSHLGVQTLPFPTMGITGTALSTWYDSGIASPNYRDSLIDSDLGSLPSATLSFEFQGAHEDPLAPGTPAIATAGAWVDPSLITHSATIADPLDGYRFFRFRITGSYPPPPVSSTSSVLPRVSSVYLCP